jgi:PAS domain S-box-containing protein
MENPMTTSDLDQEKARLEEELRIQRQIAFASGLFQGDVTIRTLLESLAEGVVIIDNSGTILLVNVAAEQLFGYQRKDLIGKSQAILIPELFHKVHVEYQEHIFAEPRIRPTDQLHDLAGLRRDGSEFPVEISLNYIETINGVLIMALISDITLRKQFEAEVQEAREYAENIVETVREPLVVMNSDLKILTANHSFFDTFKATPGETIGNFIYDLGNRQWDIPKLRVLFEEILPHDTVINGYEVEHDFLDIGRKTILLNARQIFREKIGSHIILLAMEDITERKRLETEIQDALEYAENIVETVREPLVVLNSDLKILTANHSFFDTFKVTPEETIGNFIYDLGNRQWDIPKLRVLLEEILPNDTVFNGYEVEHDFQDIGRKIILLNARQIFRETIGSHTILLAMEDITERKQAEEEIERVNTELEAANLELEAFNYTVAHDLRNPLNVISSYCQVFKELCGDKLDEQCMRYIRETYEGTLRMNRLIEALLNFSRMAHAELSRDRVDLSSMAKMVSGELRGTEGNGGERRHLAGSGSGLPTGYSPTEMQTCCGWS